MDLAPYGCQVFLDFSEVADDARGSLVAPVRARSPGSPCRASAGPCARWTSRPVRDAFRDVLAALRSAEPLPGDRRVRAVRRCGRGPAARRRRSRAPAPWRSDGTCARSRSSARWKAPAAILAGPGRRTMARPGRRSPRSATAPAARIEEWLLDDLLRAELHEAGCPAAAAESGPGILAVLLAHPSPTADAPFAPSLLSAPEAGSALRVNTFDGVRWFDRECFELLADMAALAAAAAALTPPPGSRSPSAPPARLPAAAGRAVAAARRLCASAEAAGWRWDAFLAARTPKTARLGKRR